MNVAGRGKEGHLDLRVIQMIENGSAGIVFALLALWRADWDDPFARGFETPGYAYSIGQTYEDRVEISQEFRVSHFSRNTIGPVQLMWDASVTTKGGIYLGAGSHIEYDFNLGPVPAYVGMSALIGLWHQGNDVDLGFPVEFRTDIELGVQISDTARIGIVTDHRSHARMSKLFNVENFRNSGMESIAIRYTQQY